MKYEVEDGSVGALERGDRKTDAEKQEMQKKMEAAATPGPAHKALDALAGNWTAEVKCWYEPGGAPEVSQATAKTRWILNGRFLEEEFHGQMMGKPFVGRSLLGYDNTKQKFNMVWISDAQTSMFFSEGKGEDNNRILTLEGRVDCPETGQRNLLMKIVFRVLSPDKHVFEMYDESRGRNAKTMEIIYTKA